MSEQTDYTTNKIFITSEKSLLKGFTCTLPPHPQLLLDYRGATMDQTIPLMPVLD